MDYFGRSQVEGIKGIQLGDQWSIGVGLTSSGSCRDTPYWRSVANDNSRSLSESIGRAATAKHIEGFSLLQRRCHQRMRHPED